MPYTLQNHGNQVRYVPDVDYTSVCDDIPYGDGDDRFDFYVEDGVFVSPDHATVTLVVQKGGLVITEIMHDPANTDDEDWEWIEVANTSDHPIVLEWLTDDDQEDDGNLVVSASIPAGELRVIAPGDNNSRLETDMLAEWHALPRAQVVFAGDSATWDSLGNDGDRIQVIRGSLKGLEGTLVEFHKKHRVRVIIDGIQQSLHIKIPISQLRVI